MIQKLKKSDAGFTLVELIVVIAILGVLMAVLVPQYIQYVEKSRESTDLSTLGEVIHAAEITAATAETAPTSYVLPYVEASKSFTVAAALQSTLGATIKLKSSDGQNITGDQTISFDSNGKATWAASATPTLAAGDTNTHFSTLTNGIKGS